MPYAKIDVAFIRDHFAAVPEKDRAAAIALYVQLVLTSGELLLDGVIPRSVAEAGGAEIGISRGRYARRENARVCASLVDSGLVEIAKDGTLTLTKWEEHHSARSYVEKRRKSDAERKRGQRGQLTIGDDAPGFHSGRPQNVRSGIRSGVRTLARGTESESEDLSSSSAVARDAPPDDDDLRSRLDQLGVNGRVYDQAIAEPDRAHAWLAYTDQHANGNRAGYFATSFTNGGWPPDDTPAAPDPDARRERFLTTNGYLLPDDELEYQLRTTYAATDDDVVTALERAHDLRHASVST